MMAKNLSATCLGGRRIELSFSDGVTVVWNAEALLARTGPLLVPLQDQAYFGRIFRRRDLAQRIP
jgi:hypothetical protein